MATPRKLYNIPDRSVYQSAFTEKMTDFNRTRSTPEALVQRQANVPVMNLTGIKGWAGKKHDGTRGKKPAPAWFVHHHSDPYIYSDMPTQRLIKERPEEFTFRLWGRINASHCPVPYDTESQRNYINHKNNYNPPKRHHLRGKLVDKDYIIALAHAKMLGRRRG
jgi:hypothetical protein